MPRKIILIRHGETEFNRLQKWQGWSEVPLNRAGKNQAQLLARRLKHEVIDVLYTSDLKRAAETAAIIATSLGIEPKKTDRLRERNMGIFEGLTWEEAEKKNKKAFRNFFDIRNETFKDHGGETFREVKARIKSFFMSLRKKHKDDIVAIVTHGGTTYYILTHLTEELPADLRFGNTAITILKKDRLGQYHTTLLGDISHLEVKDEHTL